MVNQSTLPTHQGLVIAYFGSSVAVEADNKTYTCHLRRNQPLPVVGDQVAWVKESEDTGIVQSILPRSSMLGRGDGQGNLKPLAANINMVVVVMAPPPIFSNFLVDRYLIAAEILSLPAMLVINKSDLLTAEARDQLSQMLEVYKQISYPVIFSSAVKDGGLHELATALSGKQGVLVGPSGVGKSSIIAGLAKPQSIRIGEVSAKGAGKHTTTGTRLYHLQGAGSLIDSPGVREFNLWKVNENELLQGFREFLPFSAHCKFRNCAHLVEPGCGVQQAISDGRISASRHANYQTLMKEMTAKNQKK